VSRASFRLVSAVVFAGGLTAALVASPLPARFDQTRTVYFSAVDAKGALVSDLTAADVTVKEGGKDRTVASLEPASAPMQVAILIDDGGSGVFQPAVLQFIQATLGHAQYAISLMNPQPMKILDYSDNVEALRAAVGKLGQRGRIQSAGGEQIIEAVSETAREMRQHEARRPIMLVLTTVGETQLSDHTDEAMTNLKNSGAALSVVHITGIDIGGVLGDGPKQSGGTIEQVADGVMIGQALAKVANTLMHQYVLTYTLPEGVKPNERLVLSTSRKGIKLVAPTKIADR